MAKKKNKKRFAIFVSGNGTNMENIIKAVKSKKIKNAKVACVFSDNPKCNGLKRARRQKVGTFAYSPKDFKNKIQFEKEIVEIMKEDKVDFIILAGYMRLVGKTLLKQFPNKILNIHPALLPSFPGRDGIGDAWKYGVKVTGVTVHLVDDGVDTGPIILQESIEVREKETLSELKKRIHKLEYKLYPKAIQLFIDNKIKITRKKG